MLKGFKEFLARGNIVDLAVAVVIGTAFTALVTKFTDSIITPLINRIRDLLAQTNGDSPGRHGGRGTPSPTDGPRASTESQ